VGRRQPEVGPGVLRVGGARVLRGAGVVGRDEAAPVARGHPERRAERERRGPAETARRPDGRGARWLAVVERRPGPRCQWRPRARLEAREAERAERAARLGRADVAEAAGAGDERWGHWGHS